MKNSIETLKNSLYQLVKMDYGFELYNDEDNIIRFSFYHLNSVYNAFCTAYKNNNRWYNSGISWQYATVNKKAALHAEKIVTACIALRQLNKKDLYNSEIEYYKNLSSVIYKAKYSNEVWLHTDI